MNIADDLGADMDAYLINEHDPARRVDLLNVMAANVRHTDLARARAVNTLVQQHAQAGVFATQPYHQGLADCFYWRGKFHALEDQHEEALACFYQALDYCTYIMEPPPTRSLPYADAPDHFLGQYTSQLAMHNILGVTLVLLEHLEEALQHYHEAWRLANEQDDRWLQTLLASNIGYLYRTWGDWAQALGYLKQGLVLIEAFPATLACQRLRATLLDNCCWCTSHAEQHAEALAYGHASLAIYEAMQWPLGLVEIYNCLGIAYQRAADTKQALLFFQRAYQRARQQQLHSAMLAALSHIGALHWQRRATKCAINAISRAVHLAKTYQLPLPQARNHQLLSEIYEAQQQPTLALAHYKQFHALHQQLFNERSDRRLRVFQVMQQLEQARKETALHQLRASLLEQELHERKQLQTELEHLAATDALTGIFNRRAFCALVVPLLKQAYLAQQPFTLILFDIDHFKMVNDTYGHSVGDHVLRVVAQVTQTCIRQSDTLARYGGEEFIIALPGSDAHETLRVAERLRATLAAQRHRIGANIVNVTVSVGVADVAPHCCDLECVLSRADAALYQAKQSGRNQVQYAQVAACCYQSKPVYAD